MGSSRLRAPLRYEFPLINLISDCEERLSISRRLFIHDVQLPDPFTMDVSNDFKHCPPFGLFDIFNHLIYHTAECDKQGLSALKSYENYNLFPDGAWLCWIVAANRILSFFKRPCPCNGNIKQTNGDNAWNRLKHPCWMDLATEHRV